MKLFRRSRTIILVVCISVPVTCTFGFYWMRTQPVSARIDFDPKLPDSTLYHMPELNRDIVNFARSKGRQIAPNYNDVVCTEFVIAVINHHRNLSREEKKVIRIITDEDLNTLVRTEQSIIKGVQTALLLQGKGIKISDPKDVLPGDFVQFWNSFDGKQYGHCGIVSEIDPGKSVTLYSSHPVTDGYGIHKFLWPEKVYFVRLR